MDFIRGCKGKTGIVKLEVGYEEMGIVPVSFLFTRKDELLCMVKYNVES